MKGISVLFYSLKQGAKNLRQNGLFTLASIGTIAACLFLFGIFYFLVSNFQYMMRNAETSVGVTVFFNEGSTEEDIFTIRDQITAREEIADIIYVSAEEAWLRFQEDTFGDSKEELAETFGNDNPLQDSASLEVYLSDISKQRDLVSFIQTIEGVREVKSSDLAAAGLSNMNRLVGYVSATIIIILLAVAIFLINTTITMGISVRKEEIAIMRLVGATDLFIKLPFIIEGIVIGLFGAIIPLIILYMMYAKMIAFIADKFSILANVLVFLEGNVVFAVLIPVSLIVGVGIGLFGSLWTLQRHVKV